MQKGGGAIDERFKMRVGNNLMRNYTNSGTHNLRRDGSVFHLEFPKFIVNRYLSINPCKVHFPLCWGKLPNDNLSLGAAEVARAEFVVQIQRASFGFTIEKFV